MHTVLIPDAVDKAAIELLRGQMSLNVIAPGKLDRDALLAQVPEAEALIIRSGVTIDAEVIAAAPKLRAIARAGVGVDNVDLDAATERGVVVMNTPGGNTIATAEYAMGLMLALARHIPQGDASLKGGKWDRKSFTGVELRNKTLGLVGFGRIGQAVAQRARAFEMRLIAYDPYVDSNVAETSGVAMVEFDELLAQSDFISLHASLGDGTRGLINAETLAKMKDGVRIVNTARGALIDDIALAEAMKSGKVAGAALDVYAEEPPPADHPLIGLPGIIDTPHLAASTSDAQVTVAIEAAELIANFLLKNEAVNVVNPLALDALRK